MISCLPATAYVCLLCTSMPPSSRHTRNFNSKLNNHRRYFFFVFVKYKHKKGREKKHRFLFSSECELIRRNSETIRTTTHDDALSKYEIETEKEKRNFRDERTFFFVSWEFLAKFRFWDFSSSSTSWTILVVYRANMKHRYLFRRLVAGRNFFSLSASHDMQTSRKSRYRFQTFHCWIQPRHHRFLSFEANNRRHRWPW